MINKIQIITDQYTKKNVPSLRAGDTIRVHERIKDKGGERIQVFEGVVIAQKHGKGLSSTFTVRKISVHNIGVEKIFPLHSPKIQKIEVVKHDKVRRSKLYYIRDLKGKKKRKKASKMLGLVYEEAVEEPETMPEEEASSDEAEKAEDTKETTPEAKTEQTPEETTETKEEVPASVQEQTQNSQEEESAQSNPQEESEADKKTE